MPTGRCAFCDASTNAVCIICHSEFCTEHAGTDNDFCQECSSEDAVKVEVTNGLSREEENKNGDLETVSHPDIRILRPVGEFFISTPGAISKMSDEELERFYNRYTLLVKDTEAALDRHRIVRSMIAMEKDERDRHKIKVDKDYKPTAKKIAKAVEGASLDTRLNIIAAVLKKQGFTKEKLKAIIEAKKGAKTHATS